MSLRLEPFSESDFDRLISWIPDASFLLQWAGPVFSFPLDHAQLREHLARSRQEPPNSLLFRGVDVSTGSVIGHIEISNIDRRNQSGRISRVLVGPCDLRGSGIGGQLVGAALTIAFEELRLHRVELYVFDFNKSAIACYERAGFKHEGILRDARKSGNEYWSLCVMSILKDEHAADMTETQANFDLTRFTLPAQRFWTRIPVELRSKLIANVWCGSCSQVTTIVECRGTIEGGDLVIEGLCKRCKQPVARVVEGA